MPNASSIALALALVTAAGLVAAGLLSLFRSDPAETHPPAGSSSWLAGSSLLLALAIAIGGFAIRAADIELRGMTHVEVYVPGIELPEDISTPNERIGLARTLLWHYFREPHPPVYYVMGWFWTRALGTDLWVLRLPSVLFAGLSIFLTYLIAARYVGRNGAWIAALLLAFHGQHILYSEYARMYSMGTCLGLLSTMVWMRLLEQRTPQRRLEIAYVAVTTLGLYTQTLLWVLLAAQMLYTIFTRTDRESPPRPLGLQLACVILAAPIVSQAILLSRPSPFEIGPLAFLIDFLNFGFLYPPNPHPISGPRDLPALVEAGLVALSVGILAAGLRVPFSGQGSEDAPPDRPASMRGIGLMAVGVATLLLSLSTNYRVWQRTELFAASAALPLIAWGVAALLPRLQPIVRTLHPLLQKLRDLLPGLASPIAIVALLPTLMIVVLTPVFSLLVARGLLFSVPFLLVLIAAGMAGRGPLTTGRKVLIAAVIVIHMGSWMYTRGFSSGANYRELAADIRAEIQPGELIFVNYRDWGTTPLFYHLPDHFDYLVATDYAGAIASARPARVWQILIEEVPSDAGMEKALCGYVEEGSFEHHNIRAAVRVPGPPATRRDCDSPTAPAGSD